MINSRQLSLVLLVLMGAWSPPVFSESSFSTPPYDQTIAQVDPNQPIQIRIINRTPHPLEYGLADPFPQIKEVQAGEQIELYQVRIPNCLGINTPMLAPVQYHVSTVPGNWIEVEVKVSPEIYGVHCLELRLDGELYVY